MIKTETITTINELYDKYRTEEPIPISDQDFVALNSALHDLEGEFRSLSCQMESLNHLLELWRGIFTKKIREIGGMSEFDKSEPPK